MKKYILQTLAVAPGYLLVFYVIFKYKIEVDNILFWTTALGAMYLVIVHPSLKKLINGEY